MATEDPIGPDDQPGSLIGIVLANLVERVTALERGHRPRLRPIVLEQDDDEPRGKAAVRADMAKMYTVERWSMGRIAKLMDCDVKTVRSYLRAAGILPPAQKREKV